MQGGLLITCAQTTSVVCMGRFRVLDRCADQFIPQRAPTSGPAFQAIRSVSRTICSTFTAGAMYSYSEIEGQMQVGARDYCVSFGI